MTLDSVRTAEETPLALLRPHWRLVLASFLGWFLDAFDQVALLLVLPEIGKHFGASLTAMGLVITAQSVGRIFGNIGWGWLADRYGRKLTFMASVIWFAAFSGLSGLAWSYAALLVIQLLFGIGFGGEWTASASLLMESVPDRARSTASSLMMAGYECGFFAAAGVEALIVPHYGWRALFIVGVVPAVLVAFIRVGVSESPVWLRTQRERAEARERGVAPEAAARPRFRMDVAAWQACAFMASLQFLTASVYAFYPTLLKTVHGFSPNDVFAAIAAYSIGSIGGKLLAGWLAARVGDRPTILGCLLVTSLGIVPFGLRLRPAAGDAHRADRGRLVERPVRARALLPVAPLRQPRALLRHGCRLRGRRRRAGDRHLRAAADRARHRPRRGHRGLRRRQRGRRRACRVPRAARPAGARHGRGRDLVGLAMPPAPLRNARESST